jgi:hypothetical protein
MRMIMGNPGHRGIGLDVYETCEMAGQGEEMEGRIIIIVGKQGDLVSLISG